MTVTKVDITRQGGFSGDTSVESHKLTNVLNPTSAQDAATKNYVDAATTGADAVLFKGVIDASANPNYPAADAGHLYRISVAGKVGGASGVSVEVGDTVLCITDATASGTQAAVGANWNVVQANIDGAVIGPASATDSGFALFNGTTGKVVKDSGVTLDTDTALAANSDSKIASQKAIKAYADTKQAALGFTAENVANKDTDTALAANSDTKYPSQKAVKAYVDAHAGPTFVVRETPGGAVNGVNTTFTLASAPTAGSEELFLNGVLQEPGTGNDYTISSLTITYLAAPLTGDRVRASYRH